MCDIYMYMKRYRNILFLMVMLVMMLGMPSIFVGCSNDNDTVLNQQQKSIENYLKSSHNPRLIDEAEVSESMDDNPPFYTRWDMNIYRYIATYYNEGRDALPKISNGTTFDITYTAYIFTGNAPTINNMFATNDINRYNELVAQGLTPSDYWDLEPKRVTLGDGDLFDSLETALKGCYEGDEVEIYLTYPEAYGKDYIGKVPSKSPQVWFIKIVDVL